MSTAFGLSLCCSSRLSVSSCALPQPALRAVRLGAPRAAPSFVRASCCAESRRRTAGHGATELRARGATAGGCEPRPGEALSRGASAPPGKRLVPTAAAQPGKSLPGRGVLRACVGRRLLSRPFPAPGLNWG